MFCPLANFLGTILFRRNYRYLPTVIFAWYTLLFGFAALLHLTVLTVPLSDPYAYKRIELTDGQAHYLPLPVPQYVRLVGTLVSPILASGEVLALPLEAVPRAGLQLLKNLGLTECREGLIGCVELPNRTAQGAFFVLVTLLMWATQCAAFSRRASAEVHPPAL